MPMSSNAGSTMPSGSRVKRAAVVLHGTSRGARARVSRGSRRSRASEGVELARRGRRPDRRAGEVERRDRPRRRRDDAAGAAAVPRDGHPGDRRQLRSGRLPQRDRRGTSSRAASRGSSAASSRSSSSRRSKSRPAESDSWQSTMPSSRAASSGGWSRSSGRSVGEDFGRVPCDGLICSTPSGSTAYNLSNGGPVLMWGLDAMALTFVAPHDLRARPFVVPRGPRPPRLEPNGGRRLRRARRRSSRRRLRARGHASRSGSARERSLLGTLPDATFVRRYRQSFGSA